MQTEIFCPYCNQEYSDDNLPRLLIGCGDTFCQQCLLGFIVKENGVLNARCPEDGCLTFTNECSVTKFPKNLALIKVIQSKNASNSFKENEIDISKITKNSSILDQQDAPQIINMINGPKDQKQFTSSNQIIKPEGQKQRIQICQQHKKPLDVVCIVDLKKICSSCAIFGQHRGHEFKSLEEVTQIHSQYCNDISKIRNEKQKIWKQILSQETKNDILSLLSTKKEKMKKKISEEFLKLMNKISKKEKQVLASLEELAKKQQNYLQNCIKIDNILTKEYNKWQEKSKSQLKILEENDFQSQLILLFQGKNIDGDIIQQGNGLLRRIKLQEQNILLEVEKKLENLNMKVNHQIYNKIQEFVQVFTEDIHDKVVQTQLKNQPAVKFAPQRPSLAPISANALYFPPKYGQKKPISLKGDFTHNRIEEQRNETLKRSNSSFLHSSSINQHLDESLLQEDAINEPQVAMFQLRLSSTPMASKSSLPLSQRFFIEPNVVTPPQKQKCILNKTQAIKGNDVVQSKMIKMDKKKLSKIKLPEKYQKVAEALVADSLQIIDLTGAQLGDSIMTTICQSIGSKARTLKLIRNKLTDEGIAKLLPHMSKITTLNLSQNLLTQNILDILYQNRKYVPNLKTLVLSQNKIVQRKSKSKIEKIRKLQWNISI